MYNKGDFVYKKLLGCVLFAFGSVSAIFGEHLPGPVGLSFRLLGLMSIPIFVRSLITGFERTRNSGNYFLRLSLTASLAQLILFLFNRSLDGSAGFSLNPMYALLIGFGLVYGLEILVPCGPRRIASMRLLEANAQTKSDRFDIRVSPQDLVEWPKGMKVPNWPIAMLQLFGISLVVFCLALPFVLPVHLGVFIVLLVLVFYAVDKVVSGPNVAAAFLCMAMLLATYMFIQYRLTRELDPVGVSIATVFISYLPEKGRRPGRIAQYAYYAFYPVHILVLILVSRILFGS